MAGDVVVVAHQSQANCGPRRRVLNCRAMNATTPERETSPPARVSLVLHPRRDVQDAIDQVTAWARRTGTELAAVEDGRLPGGSGAVQSTSSPTVATSCSRSAATGRCSEGCAWPRRSASGAGREPRPPGLPHRDRRRAPAGGARGAGRGGLRRRGALHAARRWKEDGGARAGRLQRRRPEPRARARPGVARAPRRRPAARPLRQRRRDRRHAVGSTAYSYAAGGPIVSPQTRAMIITPDAPHGLFNRAVVLGAEESLGVEILPSVPRSRSRSTGSCS